MVGRIHLLVDWSMVTEVKLHYFHGHGGTTGHNSGSKKSIIAQKDQNCQIHSEKEEKFLFPPSWYYYHGHGSSVILLPLPW